MECHVKVCIKIYKITYHIYVKILIIKILIDIIIININQDGIISAKNWSILIYTCSFIAYITIEVMVWVRVSLHD
mgnify:CR=1 FL=1